MGKRQIAMLFCIGLLLICGCHSKADEHVDGENPDTEILTDTQALSEDINGRSDEESTQADDLNSINVSPRLIYSGEVYTWQDVTFVIPADWQGKYIIEEDENNLHFFQKASREKDETLGWLGVISKRSDYFAEGDGELVTSELIAYTDEGTFYYFGEPTDMTCYYEDEAILEEYSSMMSQMEWLAGSLVIANENVHYDVNQYEIPVSSIILLEEHHLVNLNNNELWIARNEIYARHGKIFQNAYLASYFNSCSWYEAKEGKADVSERELNEVEIANLKLIIEAEEAYAKAHPYPKQHMAEENVELALYESEHLQSVRYEATVGEDWEHTCTLTIDGKVYNLDDYITLFTPVQDIFYVTDISEYDGKLELAILDDGPSADPVTHFFQYDGTLRYVGEVQGFPFEEYGSNGMDGFVGPNSVIGMGRTDLIETAYVDSYYWYNSAEGTIAPMELVSYAYKWYNPHELYLDIPLYYTADEDAPMLTLPAQKEVFFIATDCKEWIFVRGKDGVEGYLRIQDGQILNIGLPAEEVFSELNFFG